MRLWSFIGCVSLLLSCSTSSSAQDSPVALKYPLTQKEGPYVVYVSSFRGDESLTFANNLAEELRTRHRLLAFVFERVDESAKADSKVLHDLQVQQLGGTDKIHGTEERQKLKKFRVLCEYAVFVGNYPSFEKAKDAADRIKKLEPPQSIPQYGIHEYRRPDKLVEQDEDNSRFGEFNRRIPTEMVQGDKLAQQQMNPFRQAFPARNPALPRAEARQQNSFDPAWIQLNAKEPHSIFTCPKPWTIIVAKFEPPVIVQSTFRSSIFNAADTAGQGRGLEVAAENGRKLAEYLRDGGRGYDAYVFHTRTNTIVTVGAFDKDDARVRQAWEGLKELANTPALGKVLLKVPELMPVPRRN